MKGNNLVLMLVTGLVFMSLLYNNDVQCKLAVTELLSENENENDDDTQTASAREEQRTARKSDKFDHEANSRKVARWRASLQQAIQSKDKENVSKLRRGFKSNIVIPCEYTFIDLGANVGDTLRKFIDSGFPEIDGKQWLFNHEKAEIGDICYGCTITGKPRPETWTLPKYMKENMKGKQPEDYCYYGVEGNPTFTSTLKDAELRVMNMDPRPVRHVHFFTQHIGTGKDGPSTLYLDKVNPADNFWGSSIYKSHWDVAKSGGDTGTPVTGITLTTLLRETVKPGGHVIVKIDIEGAEYPMMEEALQSNILCHLVKDKGVSISMVLEPHEDKVIGSDKPRLHWEEIKGEETIKNCGVKLHVGDMDW